ncbi:MAG: patatin-like phospholipase family protein [Crocinitomicaceae bacterium]|nr:patatin-like phospholipase family protein [Crocinitomicaceae bacterium]
MTARLTPRQRLRRIRYFFPIQLLVLHIKKDPLLLFLWFLLFGFTTNLLASGFGVPQQFLIPEYNGKTGFVSFGIVGFALGGFITAFNLYSYIMHGYRFPFIATLSKPFQKFSLNNFLIPAFFIIAYSSFSIKFQIEREFISLWSALLNIFSFLFGVGIFQSVSYFYFLYTNKDASAYGKGKNKKIVEEIPVDSPFQNPLKWWTTRRRVARWHVETYIFSFSKIHLARDSKHYDKKILERVFSQNHINAAWFELVLIISFLVIGTFRENPFFLIPAAASALLFFTMLLMFVSALHSWVKGWNLAIVTIFLVLLNFFYSDLKIIRLENRAYGLNYENTQAEYVPAILSADSNMVKGDVKLTLNVLDNWRKKLNTEALRGGRKPKLVIIATSGGGSRAAFWTMKSLATADSLCGGRLMNHTSLITGASGGMIGAAYLRELFLRQVQGGTESIYDTTCAENIARDLLNPIILSMTVNDWFIRYQKLRDGNYYYTKDRGWAFEKQLGENTDYVFDKRLSDYRRAEEEALIPMMVLSPTIINDGRRLLISSLPVSYLTQTHQINGDPNPLPEDIEFSRLFAKQDAEHLRFITALRMNATFPYVLPMATLPSNPPIEVMDAGIRDNFGLKTTMKFLYTFRNWINTNTSGVVIVQVRDLPKGVDLSNKKPSLFGRFAAPLGSIYGNMTKTQDYSNEEMLRYLKASFDQNIELITFQLHQDRKTHISLSWHLTQWERKQIREATKDPFFIEEVGRLKNLLESP